MKFPSTKLFVNADGVLATSNGKQIHIWEEYYKELPSTTDQETESLCSCIEHVGYAHFTTSTGNITLLPKKVKKKGIILLSMFNKIFVHIKKLLSGEIKIMTIYNSDWNDSSGP